jgi:hypothetical protein
LDSLAITGLIYMSLGAQVFLGFPPVYKSDGSVWSIFVGTMPSEEEIFFLLKTAAPAVVLMFIENTAGHPLVSLVALLTGVVCGLVIRKRVKRDYGVVLPSVIHPFPKQWPMFAFDCWAVGLTVFLVALFWLV